MPVRLGHITPKWFEDCAMSCASWCEDTYSIERKRNSESSSRTLLRGSVRPRPTRHSASLLDDHRALEPPDPIPNSEVKRRIADGSVGLPHVRVGHRQAPKRRTRSRLAAGFFMPARKRWDAEAPTEGYREHRGTNIALRQAGPGHR